MLAYTLIDNGFCISLNLSLYARPAVMKALYRFHEQFIISFELDAERIHIYFESAEPLSNIERTVAAVYKELSFQMIRHDTMKRTSQVRQLLVARALYATCVEGERTLDGEIPDADGAAWQDDLRSIFSSWSSEQ